MLKGTISYRGESGVLFKSFNINALCINSVCKYYQDKVELTFHVLNIKHSHRFSAVGYQKGIYIGLFEDSGSFI